MNKSLLTKHLKSFATKLEKHQTKAKASMNLRVEDITYYQGFDSDKILAMTE